MTSIRDFSSDASVTFIVWTVKAGLAPGHPRGSTAAAVHDPSTNCRYMVINVQFCGTDHRHIVAICEACLPN